MRRSRVVVATVFLLTLLRFGWRVDGPDLAAARTDPVAGITAQDEVLYSRIALTMVETGDWLTPRFMQRYALWKPPLNYWLTAAAVRVLGPSRLAFRLPALVAASVAATAVFAWLLPLGFWPALAGWLLAVCCPLLHVLARVNLMDALLACLFTLAAAVLRGDPALERGRSRVFCGVLLGAAVMTKAVAGGLILVFLLLYWFAAARRPRPRALAEVCGLAALLALPWHLYQLAVHTRWFWAEYILEEHLGNILHPAEQSSRESHLLFYARRALAVDPLLLVALLTALPALARAAWRRTEPQALILAGWLAAVAAGIAGFGYRNLTYLLPLVPAAAVAAVAYGPLGRRRCALPGVVLLAAGFCVRVAYPAASWGLPFPAQETRPVFTALKDYAALGRPDGLVLVAPADDFTATLLPLNGLRYAFPETERTRNRPAMDFRALGLQLGVDDFLRRDALRAGFRERLRAFGLETDAPLGSVIEFRSPAELERLLAASPELDFYLPPDYAALPAPAHARQEAPGGGVFLLAARP